MKRRPPCAFLTALLSCAIFLVLAPGVAAQASPQVPPLDPAYADLDALLAAGWVRGLLTAREPLSRMAFARAVAEAGATREAGTALGRAGDASARVREAFDRLAAAFAYELSLLCDDPAQPCPRAAPYARIRRADADLAALDAPVRGIPTLYTPVFTPDGRNLDADVAPFLERVQGRALDDDGWTVGAEGGMDFALGHAVAGAVRPRVWAWDRAGVGAEARVTLLEAYVRGVFGNLSVDVGRRYPFQGHARVYGPVFSHNARAFDQVRLGMEDARRLPWIFRHLGPSRFALWVGDMGRDQDIPGSKLIVIEGSILPHPNLEMSGTLLNHQFGEGAPPATFGQRVRDLLFMERRRLLPFDDQGEFSDKVMAADLRLTLPGIRSRFSLGFMTTDDHNLFGSPGDGLGNNAAWTLGAEVFGLGRDGRTDLWVEGTRTGVRAYTHHQFTTGMALDRRVLGAPVGPLATGVQGGAIWTGAAHTVALVGAWERYSGDEYWENPDGRRYERIADNPDEIRLRTTLDWTRRPARTGVRTTLRLGYEHVTRFDFTDRSRNNLLAQVAVGYAW